ncbi:MULTISPECIES: primosomal protein N' [unclassified Nitratiruptor]|uniref:primosomal protein N' n=1 Tax=unclassified Nitratiruptor TaxID=2624044 RepID=UPI001915D0B8|nr:MULTISPECIES: primosomal protein N' [unclassified Nitratiruptor]
MHYYEIALINTPLQLTYSSKDKREIGEVVEVSLRNRHTRGVIVQEITKPTFECLPIENSTSFFYSSQQIAIAQFIAKYYVSSFGEAIGLFVPFKENQKKQNAPLPIKSTITLSSQQQEAVEFIKSHPVSLLFGETGSGKTEIYIELIKEKLSEGKSAIFLMPEISLTPQMEKRLQAVFGDAVVIWHSKLTKKKRELHLEKIYDSTARVVAGPRSALFLPLQNLGLIVVDEEHDDSYKALSVPRINAKDVAIYMGKKLDIPVVLGSATPSVTSYYKYPHFQLKKFYQTKKDFLFDTGNGFTPTIIEELEQVLSQKKQALIFIPTRAHFKYLICQECGEAVKCPYCDVGMSVHFDKRALRCHYCNFTEFIPQKCPYCGSEELSTKRMGTSEAVEELQTLFPQAVIEKFDKDVVTTQKKLETILQRFSNKEIDILVGTQMLSKGHDYPDVTLSVIFGLDFLLAMADYRAREKAVALLLQIAGRAGRREDAKVIVQTKNVDFFKRYLDFKLFLQEELALRQGFYPPFVRLALLRFSHKNRQIAQEAMEEVLQRLQAFKSVEIVGYGPNAIEKIAGKFRFHILLKSAFATELLKAIYASKNELCEVDIDPVNFT